MYICSYIYIYTYAKVYIETIRIEIIRNGAIENDQIGVQDIRIGIIMNTTIEINN
jgi:hypothetical protein